MCSRRASALRRAPSALARPSYLPPKDATSSPGLRAPAHGARGKPGGTQQRRAQSGVGRSLSLSLSLRTSFGFLAILPTFIQPMSFWAAAAAMAAAAMAACFARPALSSTPRPRPPFDGSVLFS